MLWKQISLYAEQNRRLICTAVFVCVFIILERLIFRSCPLNRAVIGGSRSGLQNMTCFSTAPFPVL